MKKVLVAAAGLMLVGTMASTAMAEFYFSGDARARFYYQDNYELEDETNWKSRVRLNVKADTKGGAYAVTRFKVGDGTWDGGASGTGDVVTDRAYIGVPFGPITVEAGRQARDITNFLYYGATVDGIDFNYKNDKTLVVAFYDINDEGDNVTSDDDNEQYGVVLVQGFEGGWNLTVGAAYLDNQIADTDGFMGTVNVAGALGAASVMAEVAYQEEGSLSVTDDDGWGGYVQVSMPVGPANIMGQLGFTTDGFQWDNGDFGVWEMIGDVNQINTGINPSAEGETFFAVLNPSFQATEKLNLAAVLSYVSVDPYDGSSDVDLFEISGVASYAVVDGAKLVGRVGYLDTDDYTEDDPFGVGLSLEVSF